MHTILRSAAAALLLAMPGLLAPCLAHAHAELREAEPPVGSTVRGAPAQVKLTFSAAVELRFSSVAVTDAAGAQVDKGDLHAGGGDAKHWPSASAPCGPAPTRWSGAQPRWTPTRPRAASASPSRLERMKQVLVAPGASTGTVPQGGAGPPGCGPAAVP